MPAEPKQWQRIADVEASVSLYFWHFAIGLGLTIGTAMVMWNAVAHMDQGLPGILGLLSSSIWAVLFFLAGLVVLGATVYTMIDKGRNKLWLDLEMPVQPGEKLRARLGSDRALAIAGEVEVEATLNCKRRDTEIYEDHDRKRAIRAIEILVWSAKQRFPLVAGLASLEFELDIPADALPGAPGAEGTYGIYTGVFWSLDIYFKRNNVFVNRSYRFLMSARA